MTTAGPTLRSQVAPALLGYLASRGIDIAPIASSLGLPPDLEAFRETPVPLASVHRLGEVAEELTRDPFVGLHVAEWLPRGAYGLSEFIVRSAADIREAATRLVRHHALLNDFSTLSFEDRLDEGVLVHAMPGEPACAGRHGNELIVAMMVRVVRESLRLVRWSPSRVAFAHPQPEHVGPLAFYFGAEIAFAAGRNEVAVPRDDLALPLQTADAALLAVLDEQAMRHVAPPTGDAFWTRLREEIRVSLRDGPPRLEAIAAAIGTSTRTLQRRLEAEGTTFQHLVDDLRHTLARMYLDEPSSASASGRPLAPLEVAFLLGYADRRAFVRAFKRWTGTTPSDYRRKS